MQWVSDLTHVTFVYVAFVINVYAGYIVGWRVSRSAHASFVLDALEQAIMIGGQFTCGDLIHHSGRGSQGGIKRSSQTPNKLEVAMGQRRQGADRCGRPPLQYPGRPSARGVKNVSRSGSISRKD